MSDRNSTNYSYSVSQLLSLGPATGTRPEEWLDYVGLYGLGEEEVAELVRLASEANTELARADWGDAPIHACRALGQIGDRGADLYLVKLLDDASDPMKDSVLFALSMLGLPGLKALERYFDFPSTDMWGQIAAAEGAAVFAQRNPLYRAQCVAFLTLALEDATLLPATVNGFLVYYLVELQATESSAVIEQAFQDNAVSEDVIGYWADVQVELGLASVADFAPGELLYPEDKVDIEQPARTQRTPEIELSGSYSITQHLKR